MTFLTPITREDAAENLSVVDFKNTPLESLKTLLKGCHCYFFEGMTVALMMTTRNTLWVQALGGVSTGNGASTAFEVCEVLARHLKIPLEFQTARKGLARLAEKRGYMLSVGNPFTVCRWEPKC